MIKFILTIDIRLKKIYIVSKHINVPIKAICGIDRTYGCYCSQVIDQIFESVMMAVSDTDIHSPICQIEASQADTK